MVSVPLGVLLPGTRGPCRRMESDGSLRLLVVVEALGLVWRRKSLLHRLLLVLLLLPLLELLLLELLCALLHLRQAIVRPPTG